MADSFMKSLKLTKISLLINGITICPAGNKTITTFLNFLYYFNILWLYQDFVAELNWLANAKQLGKNFEEMSLIVPCLAVTLLSTSKTFAMFYYKDIVIKVVEKLAQIHPAVDETPLTGEERDEIINIEYFPKDGEKINTDMSEKIERKIVHEAISFLNIIIRLWSYTCATVVVTWSFLPLGVMGYEYYKHGETTMKLPFFTIYFFDQFTKTTWPLVYLHQVVSTFIAGFYVFGGDTFLYTFCMYIHMHYQTLCHRYEFMVSDSVADTKKRLNSIVKRHHVLIDLVDQVQIVFGKSILINIVMSSVLICLCAFNITISNDGGAVFAFATFLASQIIQISVMCFFADLLMESSVKVGDAIYKSRWYDLDPGTKRNVFLILIRSQKPCRLTAANFADLNLTSLTTILSRSWSYFALLRTVYNK